MTVRTAMRAGDCGGPEHPGALTPDTVVSDAIEIVARTGRAACVTQDGRCLGQVDNAGLLRFVAGLDREEVAA